VAEQTPLTVCPLSNIKLRVFPSLAEHNLPALLERELLVTINSDDPAYFGGYVADNYLAIAAGLGLNLTDLAALATSSLNATLQ
jgi:adenosine deaminase